MYDVSRETLFCNLEQRSTDSPQFHGECELVEHARACVVEEPEIHPNWSGCNRFRTAGFTSSGTTKCSAIFNKVRVRELGLRSFPISSMLLTLIRRVMLAHFKMQFNR